MAEDFKSFHNDLHTMIREGVPVKQILGKPGVLLELYGYRA